MQLLLRFADHFYFIEQPFHMIRSKLISAEFFKMIGFFNREFFCRSEKCPHFIQKQDFDTFDFVNSVKLHNSLIFIIGR